jgi:hypothetical protein
MRVHPCYGTKVCDDDWTMFGAPSKTGEYQQLSVNTAAPLETVHTAWMTQARVQAYTALMLPPPPVVHLFWMPNVDQHLSVSF